MNDSKDRFDESAEREYYVVRCEQCLSTAGPYDQKTEAGAWFDRHNERVHGGDATHQIKLVNEEVYDA